MPIRTVLGGISSNNNISKNKKNKNYTDNSTTLTKINIPNTLSNIRVFFL